MKTVPYIGSIRHLRLQTDIRWPKDRDLLVSFIERLRHTSDLDAWQGSPQTVTQAMKNLQFVHIDVEQGLDRKPPFARKIEDGGQDEVTKLLLVLEALPLRATTITLRDQHHCTYGTANSVQKSCWKQYGPWMMAERQR